MADDQSRLELRYDEKAPNIFADGVAGYHILNGVVRITFETVRSDHALETSVMHRVVSAQVTLTIPGAQALVVGLNDFLAKNGVDASKPFQSGPMQ